MSFKIDIHAHILPSEWPDLKKRYGYGGWIRVKHTADRKRADLIRDNGSFFRAIESNCWCPEDRILDMDKAGQARAHARPQQVPQRPHSICDVQTSPEVYRLCNCTPSKSSTGDRRTQRCVTELGHKAVMIGSHVNEWNLDCKALDPFYKTAEDLDVPIFIHPWDMKSDGRMAKYWLPWLVGMPAETSIAICSLVFGGVLEKFPKLRFCFSHGAGSFPYTLGRIDHGFQVRPDLCATENNVSPRTYLGRIYADSLVHDEDALQLLIKVLGEDKILLGSDYPFPLGEQHPGKLIDDSIFLGKLSKEKILGKNALTFLNIPMENFV